MEIDKKNGQQWSSEKTSELDDLAFFLHLSDASQPGYPLIDQDSFIEFKDIENNIASYYEKANFILRTDKINKIIKNKKFKR